MPYIVSKTIVHIDSLDSYANEDSMFEPGGFNDSWWELYREGPIHQYFSDHDPAKALAVANTKAEEVMAQAISVYSDSGDCDTVGGVNNDGTIWRMALSLSAKQKCEVQVLPATLSNAQLSWNFFDREGAWMELREMKDRHMVLQAYFDRAETF
ncbi:MAG: hypothetical protein Q9179_001076 [Wetmoreana sp. 5 TL-2023]